MEKNRHLRIYRETNYMLCVDRDLALCVICWFSKGIRTQYEHVHHVLGRGTEAGDYREHYTNLMCVCAECHPLPAQDAGSKQSWVIDISKKSNENPINKKFEHQK
jgi:predicted HNH restriction endonuclease